MNVYKSMTELVGKTPVLELRKIEKEYDLKAKLFVKLEYFNPAGSVKDRVALAMIEDAERDGKLSAGSTIIEPTSGNTGIGLAAIGVRKGYRVILTMPSTMSAERRNLMKGYGAEVVLTDGTLGMKGAIAKAEEIAREVGGVVMGQFENPSNPKAHYVTTGPEIWRDLDGKIDVFVAGVGTGGTISGAGKYLKERNKNLKTIAVEPASSAVLSGNAPGKHAIQGIGAGFVPKNLDMAVVDEIFPVSDEDALAAGRMMGKTEGVLVGISSGAALFAAIEVAKRAESAGKVVLAIMPDTGDRYLSTALFSEE